MAYSKGIEKRKEKPLALPREEQCPPPSYKTSFSPSLFWQRQTPSVLVLLPPTAATHSSQLPPQEMPS